MKPTVPFYIVAFNRIKGLQKALEFTRQSTLSLEPIILDMGSTWAPYIEYRDSLNLKVLNFPLGVGPRDLWVTGEIAKIGTGGFFLADGDIDYTDVAPDAAEKMVALSNRYPWFPKIGLALKITDLPLDAEGNRLRAWAIGDWKVEWDKEIFLTGLDTTTAYYPKRETTFHYRPALRLAGKYQAVHYPWYEREETYDEEARFYTNVANAKISSTKDAPWPSASFRAKRLILIFLYRSLKRPMKSKFFGGFCVRILSYGGTLPPTLQTHKSKEI